MDPNLVSRALAWLYHASWAQLELTALKSNKYSGYATITHPFHPLRGKQFQILSTKHFNNKDILSLKTLQGTIAIPRDWTDQADPNPFLTLATPLPILSFFHLQQLADLTASLKQRDNKEEINQ